MYVIYIYMGAVVKGRRTFAAQKNKPRILLLLLLLLYTRLCWEEKNNPNVLFRRNRFIILRCYFPLSVFRPRSRGFDDDFRTETYLYTIYIYICIRIYDIRESARLFPFDPHCMVIMYARVLNVFEHQKKSDFDFEMSN